MTSLNDLDEKSFAALLMDLLNHEQQQQEEGAGIIDMLALRNKIANLLLIANGFTRELSMPMTALISMRGVISEEEDEALIKVLAPIREQYFSKAQKAAKKLLGDKVVTRAEVGAMMDEALAAAASKLPPVKETTGGAPMEHQPACGEDGEPARPRNNLPLD